MKNLILVALVAVSLLVIAPVVRAESDGGGYVESTDERAPIILSESDGGG